MSHNRDDCTLYIYHLPANICSREIERLFCKYGKITDVYLKNRRGPPFAFVEFDDPRDARDAVYDLDGYNYDGYRLQVEFSWNDRPDLRRAVVAGKTNPVVRPTATESLSTQKPVKRAGLPITKVRPKLSKKTPVETKAEGKFNEQSNRLEVLQSSELEKLHTKLGETKFRLASAEREHAVCDLKYGERLRTASKLTSNCQVASKVTVNKDQVAEVEEQLHKLDFEKNHINTHATYTDSDTSEFTGKQAAATNKTDSNTPANKPHTCTTCSKPFISQADLKRHTRIHTGEKPYKCDTCDKCFSQNVSLLKHKTIHMGEKPYKCDRCDKCFSQNTNLVVHMRTHTGEKPYKCDRCDKCFSLNSNLVVHIRTHTGEKPFKCKICEKCFSLKDILLQHMRTHTGVKPFNCDKCDKSFSQRANLKHHSRAHTGEKPYKCDKCDKCFNIESSLLYHMRTHTGEKPYKCVTCDKCYIVKQHLLIHIRTHTGEKPYKCNICDKCFNQKSNLLYHMRTHTGEKPYTCDICEKCFNNKSNLLRHVRDHSGDKF